MNEKIGCASDLDHFGDVVHANDVRAIQDGSGHRRSGAPDALLRRSGLPITSKRRAKKPFARSADEQRVAELRELRELFEQFVILREAFAKANPRIEDDLRFGDARLTRNRSEERRVGKECRYRRWADH